MVRLKRTTVVDGKEHVSVIVLDDNEWRNVKANINHIGNVRLELIDGAGNSYSDEPVIPDDKPALDEYERYRVKGEQLYQNKEYVDAIYYLEKASAIKKSSWITGRIRKCERMIKEQERVNKKKEKTW